MSRCAWIGLCRVYCSKYLEISNLHVLFNRPTNSLSVRQNFAASAFSQHILLILLTILLLQQHLQISASFLLTLFIHDCPNKQFSLDALPTWLLKHYLPGPPIPPEWWMHSPSPSFVDYSAARSGGNCFPPKSNWMQAASNSPLWQALLPPIPPGTHHHSHHCILNLNLARSGPTGEFCP